MIACKYTRERTICIVRRADDLGSSVKSCDSAKKRFFFKKKSDLRDHFQEGSNHAF